MLTHNYSIRWAFNIKQWMPTQEEWLTACKCVQSEELERIHRFVFRDDSKASMVGQLLMRKAVSEVAGVPYESIRFSRTKYGKPFVSSPSDLLKKLNYNFNISHQGDFCVIAGENNNHVGVDVMKVEYRGYKSLQEYFQLMKKQFSLFEWEYLTSPGLEKEQLQRFYRLWCLKESYVKAKGTGISESLCNISFHCSSSSLWRNNVIAETEVYVDDVLQPKWKFEESFLDENHVVAVAIGTEEINTNDLVQTSPCIPRFKIICFEDLIKNSIPFEFLEKNYWSSFLSSNEKCQ